MPIPDADLSVNAGQAYDVAVKLGLTSVEKIVEDLGPQALDAENAAAKIEAFNAYLRREAPSAAMNPFSADLVLILMIEGHIDQILDDKTEKSRMGGPGRVRLLVDLYRQYRAEPLLQAANA